MDYVIFDIDGTLASCKWRDALARAKRWEQFHSGIPFDACIVEQIEALRGWIDRGASVVYMTGRMTNASIDTREWLGRHQLPNGGLVFRHTGDLRPASVVKADMVENLRQYPTINIVAAYEDNKHCVDMFRSKGIATVKCKDPGVDPLFEYRGEMEAWLAERGA